MQAQIDDQPLEEPPVQERQTLDRLLLNYWRSRSLRLHLVSGYILVESGRRLLSYFIDFVWYFGRWHELPYLMDQGDARWLAPKISFLTVYFLLGVRLARRDGVAFFPLLLGCALAIGSAIYSLGKVNVYAIVTLAMAVLLISIRDELR